MTFWALLRSSSRLLFSALLAMLVWLVLAHSPLGQRLAHATEQATHPKPKSPSASADQEQPNPEEKNALEHVLDASDGRWELFDSFGPREITLPTIFGIQITKYMVLELIAALLIVVIYVPLARRVQSSRIPRGSFANFFEVLLTFIRDQVAKPALGDHDADAYVPFLWTLFLFILFNNLLGMVPLMGSATGSIFVTAGLALCVFFYMHGHGVGKMGVKKYVLSLWPHIDVPFPMGLFIKPLIFGIEWIGVIVRNAVLAVRLFANMFAGHMVVATFLLFIWMARNTPPGLWGSVTVASVIGIVALSLLELFVAFLQAYIFTFLTALFMGMALHPEH